MVVGIQDRTAGQLPVVVTQDCIEPGVQMLVTRGLEGILGWKSGVRAFLCLSAELGINEFPRMASGKLNRRPIKELAQNYCDGLGASEAKVRAKLAEMIGCSEGEVPLEDTVSMHMDSINMLRLMDFLHAPSQKITIGQLARTSLGELIQDFKICPSEAQGAKMVEAKQRITLSDLSKRKNWDAKLYNYVDSVLQSFGLDRTYIEDIYPVDPWLGETFISGKNTGAFYSGSAFAIHDRSVEYVSASLKATLSSWPMFRTFHVELPSSASIETTIHVAIRAGEQLWKCLIAHDRAEDLDGARKLLSIERLDSLKRAQMVQLTLVEVANPRCTVVILRQNHSVFDALSMWTWLRVFDHNLRRLPPFFTPSFKAYADDHYRFRRNRSLWEAAVSHQQRRLSQLQNLKKSLWPSAVKGELTDKGILYLQHTSKSLEFPHIPELRKKLVRESILVKAAVALLNTLETATSTAVFNVVDAGRYWPLSGEMSFTRGIDGPTLCWALDIISIDRQETVRDFLQRVHREQDELSSQVHTPLLEVLRGLGMQHFVLVIEALRRQNYNWDASMRYTVQDRTNFKELRYLGRLDHPDWYVAMICLFRFPHLPSCLTNKQENL